jgi:hypothetical protein
MSDLVRKLLLASLLLGLLLLAGCGSSRASLPDSVEEVPRIRAQELVALLDGGDPAVIVDTRSRELYERRHIPGAVSIPENETGSRHRELPKDAKIVLYCT